MSKNYGKVLIVEDDKDIRNTLKEVIELDGYAVATAENGKDAIAVLKNIETPSLILLDLMMPVMNGWEFLNYRKIDDVLITIPVAVITATESKDIKTVGKVQAVIKKPIDLNILMDWIKRYCDQS